MAETNQTKKCCRSCGSEEILPVVYGLPTAETFSRAVQGEVLLGGCVVFGNQPDWRCAKCGAPCDIEEFAEDWVKESLAELKTRRENSKNMTEENPNGSEGVGSENRDT